MNRRLFGCACGWEGALPIGKENESPCPKCGGFDIALLMSMPPSRRVLNSYERPIEIDWVSGYALGLTICPGKIGNSRSEAVVHERDVETDLKDIAKVADLVVNLMPEDELESLEVYLDEYVTEAEEIGLTTCHFPMAENMVPTDSGAVEELVRKLHHELKQGKRIVLHSRGGLGRCGLIAGAILRGDGRTVTETLRLLAEARGPACPRTMEQRQWIELWGTK